MSKRKTHILYNTRNNRRKTIKLKDNTREIEIERRKKINKETLAHFF